jgi:hypothetical protein
MTTTSQPASTPSTALREYSGSFHQADAITPAITRANIAASYAATALSPPASREAASSRRRGVGRCRAAGRPMGGGDDAMGPGRRCPTGAPPAAEERGRPDPR